MLIDPYLDEVLRDHTPDDRAFAIVQERAERVGRILLNDETLLSGGDQGTCELRKMYLLSEARGRGCGQELLDRCLASARALGYSRCYLETMSSMRMAQHLFEQAGFTRLDKPLGATGHFGCDCWYQKRLTVSLAGGA